MTSTPIYTVEVSSTYRRFEKFNGRPGTISVTTLTLGSRPRQGLARLQAKREARGSHFMLP